MIAATLITIRPLFILLAAMLGLTAACVSAQPSVAAQNLAGDWRFALDPHSVGVAEKWFTRDLPDKVTLPGGLTEQRIGDEVTVETKWTAGIADNSYYTDPRYARYRKPGNIKIPFMLQPDKCYAGAAWYQRDIEIPADWQNQNLLLELERAHWQTRVWIDDREIGSNDSLSTPHDYALGSSIAPGKHLLTIRVDNSLIVDIGVNSHSISDQTQGNWNGIIGRIELRAQGTCWLDDLQVYPEVAKKSIRVTGQISGNNRTDPVELRITGASPGTQGPNAASTIAPVTVKPNADGRFVTEIQLGENAQLWDEFSPALYQLTATPRAGTPKSVTFGLREIGVEGAQFTINGRKMFLRGTLDCAAFPKTGHPPTDVESWRRIFTTIKSYGLNHVRFHSWCPPEAAFIAADETGLYFQIEVASWANQSTTLGDGKPVDAWISAETDRIFKAYGNHPCFAFMTYGNEPGGKNYRAYLAKWLDHAKATDGRRLYSAAAGWPAIKENDYDNQPEPRIQHWKDGLKSRINARPPETITDYFQDNAKRFKGVPVVSHEIGQWCAYPNFEEMVKYTGYLKPKNFEIFRETLAENNMADQAKDFLYASGKLQVLCYKEDIESALRTTNMSGFQLLGLQDFPGQGTALVGVLDAFWEPKGYETAEEFRRFSGVTVPLARLQKRVFTTDDTFSAQIEVAHFGSTPLPAAAVSWRLVGDDGRSVAQGDLPAHDIPIGNGTALGEISLPLTTIAAPARYRLVVSIDSAHVENDWDIWIYPPNVQTPAPPDVTIVHQLDQAALDVLATGGKVLCLLPPADVRKDPDRPVIFGFSSIFWNTSWTTRQPPTTLGILCDPKNPALAEFPTEGYSNWQWWYPIQHAQPMILDSLTPKLRPIIQVIDDWNTNHRLGLVFECKVLRGRLLVSSIDLENPTDPVNAQLRRTLLDYLAGDKFHPQIDIAPEELQAILSPRHIK